MKRLITLFSILLLFGFSASAQTRPVNLTWTASTTTGVTYNVFRGPVGGPYVQLNTAPVTVLAYTDTTAAIGSTYGYQVTAVATACTPTTPVGTPCGSSAPATGTTTIPTQPAITITITLIVP